MKKQIFRTESDGFCGSFSQIAADEKAVVIIMNDDGPEDFLSKIGMKWLNKIGVSSMALGPSKEEKGLHSWPLEEAELAVSWLKKEGYKKIGICGLSAGSNMALSAAARISDITLTIAMTPMDWVYWGYFHDGLDGASERPAEGESSLSWRGKPLPYVPAPWNHPDYWKQIKSEAKRRKDMVAALNFHALAEEKHPMKETERIPVEKISGRLLLAGAEDDVLWDTCGAIQRMRKRLEESADSCMYEILTYAHCSHFIFPESMLDLILPRFAADLILPHVFRETKGYIKECRESRIDLDQHIQKTIHEWMMTS